MPLLKINISLCKGCGICVDFCPKHVLDRNESKVAVVSAEKKCTGCKLCEYLCPDFAIEVIANEGADSGQ